MKGTHVSQNNPVFEYSYCYHENDPYSLSIIKSPFQIYNNLYRNANYVWIVEDVHKLEQKPQQIEEKATVKINFVKSVEEFIAQYQNSKNIVIICHISLLSKFQTAIKQMKEVVKEIRCVMFYGAVKNKVKDNKRIFFDSVNSAIKYIKSDKNKYSTGVFVNFISLDKQKWDSNILVKTMFAMIKQKSNVQQIMKQLKQLALLCHTQKQQKKDIKLFFHQYQKNGFLKGNQAVWWYAQQKFVYRLVNRLLRVSKDPTSLFIIQPYFQDLFKNIKKLYKEQQQKGFEKRRQKIVKYKKFTCFRGAQISQNEIQFFKNNINSYIQNLGFLSTSRIYVVAKTFAVNAIFKIKVEDDQRKSEVDYGFADINDYSPHDEEQILFNPLNSFYIVKFEYCKDQNYIITLKYGQMARVLASKTKLTQQQLNLRELGENQIRESQKSVLMGNALSENSYNLQGYQNFCKKFMEIANNSQNQEAIIVGHQLIGRLALNKGDYKTFKIQFIKYLQLHESKLSYGDQQLINLIQLHLNNFDSSFGKNDQQEKAVEDDQQRIHENPYSSIFSDLGDTFDSFGQHEKAVEYYQICQIIQRLEHGENHPGRANNLSNLGIYFLNMGKFKEARNYLEKAEMIQSQNQKHPLYATILSSLGSLLYNEGKFQDAIEYYQRCEKIQKQTIGVIHPEYATTLNNFAASFINLGQHKKAVEFYQICQNIQKSTLGENHPNYVATLNNLGETFNILGQHQKAAKYLQRCEQLRRQMLGEYHPDYTIILSNLGSTFTSLDQYEKALGYYRRCQKIQIQMLGEYNSDYATTLSNLATLFEKNGKYQKAVKYLKKCETIIRQTDGQNNQDYAIILNNLGSTYDKMKQYEKAIQYYQRCAKIQRQILGEDDLDYATTLNNLGVSYDNMGQPENAVEYFQKCEEIIKKNLGKFNESYSIILHNLGSIFDSMAKYKKAVHYYRKCEKIERQIFGENHKDYAITLSNLGISLMNLKQYQQAEEYLQKSENIQRQKFGGKNLNYLKVLANLSTLYSRIGQEEKSIFYKQKRSQIQKKKATDKESNQNKEQKKKLQRKSREDVNHFCDSKELIDQAPNKQQQILEDQIQNFWLVSKFL